MNLQNVKGVLNEALPIIEAFAPTVSRALGGPFALAAGYILPVLSNAFGIKSSDIGNLANAITNDPDAHTKLERIENEHSDWLCTLMESVGNLQSAKINIELIWK